MKRFGLKAALQEQRLTIGSWMTFQFVPIAEMLVRAGFDWVVIDLEHTAIDYHEAQALILVLEQSGAAPLVRVGRNDPLIIKRVMDSGAHGVVVPDVRSAEEAECAAASIYYPPRGTRGAGLARAQGYGLDFDGYRAWLDEEAVLVVQIEHVDAVARLDEILAVPGVDAFIVGPYDLSASVGHPGEFGHPEVRAVVDEIAMRVGAAPKAAGVHVVHSDPEALRARVQEGYRFIAYGDDMVFFSEVLADAARAVDSVRP